MKGLRTVLRVKRVVLDAAWGVIVVAVLIACGVVFALSLAMRNFEEWWMKTPKLEETLEEDTGC